MPRVFTARRSSIAAGLVVAIFGGWLCSRGSHAPRVGAQLEGGPSRAALSAAPVAASVPSSAPAGLLGTVLSSAGGTIARARVCAAARGADPVAAPRLTCVDAGAKGAYWLELATPGAYTVTAQADGFAPGATTRGPLVVLAAGETKSGLDIVLDPGGAKVSGVVMDATGGPVPGARVLATSLTSALRTVAVESNREGRFALWMDPGAMTLTAEASGYAPGRAQRVAPSADVVLTLTPGSSIGGQVVAASGGPAVADVEVRAVPEGSWSSPAHRSSMSDADGLFTVRGLQPGRYRVVAEGTGWRGESSFVDIGLAQAIDHVLVRVASAASVNGSVVLRSSGEPCRQGSVSLGPPQFDSSPFDPPAAGDGGSPSLTAATAVPALITDIGADGEVRFRAVPSGRYHVVVQCAEHRLAEGPQTIDVGSSPIEGLAWKVETGLGLTVRVTDEGGQPLPNAPFRLLWPPRARDGARIAMPLASDVHGSYAVPGILYPGTYTLQADGGYSAPPVDVELRDTSGKVEATLRLTGSGSVLVNVRSPARDPIDDVTVTAVAAGGAQKVSAVALGTGKFRIGPLSRGRYRIEVDDSVNRPATAGGGDGDSVEVDGNAVETIVVLDRRGRIRGHVLDGSGQPLPDVWVSADCRGAGARSPLEEARLRLATQSGQGKRVVSDSTGRFIIGALARDATCVVRADEPEGASAERKDVAPGDADVVVTLPALGALRGTATTEDGRPIDRLEIGVRVDETGKTRSETVALKDGTWQLDRISPGRLAIFARDEQGATAELRADLAPGQTLEGVRVSLRAGPLVRGGDAGGATP
ncbi:MAG TPA: carboxypeptidase regulatory-like domain-containing protein [Polyangiaceae bacterium]|nr:carboxypeptidase regulatory-like domain-containing protein [Polyangiaceae bacterium]